MVLVKNVMSKPVVTIEPTASVYEGAKLMKESKIGCLVVVDTHGAPAGIVTESDFIRKVLAENKTSHTRIKEVMTKDLKTIKEEESLDQAARVMTAHIIRRLPVIKAKKLVGILTLKDVMKAKKVNSESDYYPYFT